MSNSTIRKGLHSLASFFGEAFEEFLAEYGNRLSDKLIIQQDDRNLWETTKEAFCNALVGGMVGSIANIGDSIEMGRNFTPAEAAEEAAAATAQEINDAIARGDSVTLREMVAETEDAKTGRLRYASIKITAAKEGSGGHFDKSMLSGVRKQDASKYLMPILRKLGIFTKYQNSALDVSFEYSGNGLRRSAAHQELESPYKFSDFALANVNLQELCENAYPVEAHINEKPKGDSDPVKAAATLFSVLRDGDRIIPI